MSLAESKTPLLGSFVGKHLPECESCKLLKSANGAIGDKRMSLSCLGCPLLRETFLVSIVHLRLEMRLLLVRHGETVENVAKV